MSNTQHTAELPAFTKAEAGRTLFHMDQDQERMFRVFQKNGKDYSTAGDVRAYLEFHAGTDVARLSSAIRDVLSAHPIYASELVEADGRAMVKKSNLPVKIDTCTATEEEAEAYIPAFAATPRAKGEALHKFVIMKTPACVYLFMRICHAVTDGFSLMLLGLEICNAYNGGGIAQENYDWFDWSAYKESAEKSHAAALLLDELGTKLSLYPDVPPDAQTHAVEKHAALLLSRAEMRDLQKCAMKMGTQKSMLLMAAYCLALMRERGQDKIAVTSSYHGRHTAVAGAIHGSMAFKLPMLAELPASDLVADYVARFVQLRNEMLESYVLLNESITSRFAGKIDPMSNLNIIVKNRPFVADGITVKVHRYPIMPAAVRLEPQVFPTDNGWELLLQSNQQSAEDLKKFHTSLRTILLNMSQTEKVSQL